MPRAAASRHSSTSSGRAALSSAIHTFALPSDGARQSPRGDSEPVGETFGPGRPRVFWQSGGWSYTNRRVEDARRLRAARAGRAAVHHMTQPARAEAARAAEALAGGEVAYSTLQFHAASTRVEAADEEKCVEHIHEPFRICKSRAEPASRVARRRGGGAALRGGPRTAPSLSQRRGGPVGVVKLLRARGECLGVVSDSGVEGCDKSGGAAQRASIPECPRKTRGTETSQYPEERKSTETPSVAASERGSAQTGRVTARGRGTGDVGGSAASRSRLENRARAGDSPVGGATAPLSGTQVGSGTGNPA